MIEESKISQNISQLKYEFYTGAGCATIPLFIVSIESLKKSNNILANFLKHKRMTTSFVIQ